MDDQEYQDRYNYLHNGKYPDHINSKDLKANFRKACHPFRASQGGILQYEHKKHGLLRVLRVGETEKVLQSCHTHPTAGHFGVNKT